MSFRAGSVLAVVVALCAGSFTWAQDATEQGRMKQSQGPTSEPAEAGGEEKALTLDASLTVPTAYMFRGYVINDTDIQLQPDFSAEYKMDVAGLTLRPHIEWWNNIVPSSDEVGTWNETDVYAGFGVDLPASFALDIVYNWYNSPAGDFTDVQEVGAVVSHDDFLQPHACVFFEVANSSVSPDGTEAIYLEAGIAPELPWKPLEQLTLTVPALLGTGLNGYYFDSDGGDVFWGFASVGLHASYAITDNLSFEAGVTYFQLLAPSVRETNDGDPYKVVADVGLAFSF